jgi:hypothetical protein
VRSGSVSRSHHGSKGNCRSMGRGQVVTLHGQRKGGEARFCQFVNRLRGCSFGSI